MSRYEIGKMKRIGLLLFFSFHVAASAAVVHRAPARRPLHDGRIGSIGKVTRPTSSHGTPTSEVTVDRSDVEMTTASISTVGSVMTSVDDVIRAEEASTGSTEQPNTGDPGDYVIPATTSDLTTSGRFIPTIDRGGNDGMKEDHGNITTPGSVPPTVEYTMEEDGRGSAPPQLQITDMNGRIRPATKNVVQLGCTWRDSDTETIQRACPDNSSCTFGPLRVHRMNPRTGGAEPTEVHFCQNEKLNLTALACRLQSNSGEVIETRSCLAASGPPVSQRDKCSVGPLLISFGRRSIVAYFCASDDAWPDQVVSRSSSQAVTSLSPEPTVTSQSLTVTSQSTTETSHSPTVTSESPTVTSQSLTVTSQSPTVTSQSPTVTSQSTENFESSSVGVRQDRIRSHETEIARGHQPEVATSRNELNGTNAVGTNGMEVRREIPAIRRAPDHLTNERKRVPGTTP